MYIKLLIVLILISQPLFTQSDWKPIDIDRKINNIHSFGEDTVFAGAQNVEFHELYKSTDKGLNWKMVFQSKAFNQEPEIEHVYLLNLERYEALSPKHHYFSVWEHEVIRVSNDSGKTFQDVYFNDNYNDNSFITGLAMYDSLRGIAVSSKFNIYTTTDGWKNYDTTTIDHIFGYGKLMYFLNKSEVFMFRNDSKVETFNIDTKEFTIISEDGGDNKDIYQIKEFCFVDKNLIYGAGSKSTDVGDQRIDIIFKSIDRGKNWKKIYNQENVPIFGLNSIDFYDRYNGVAVGFLKILLTNDGGKTWKVDKVPPEMGNYEIINSVEWVGKTPIIGTFNDGMFRYEGDYFDFDQQEPEEFYFTRSGETNYCFNTEPIDLDIMEPKGGNYEGKSIENNVFNPSIAGSGNHQISYSYTNEDDLYKDTTIIVEVYNELATPIITQSMDTLFTQYENVEWYSSDNKDNIIKISNHLIPQTEGSYVARYKDDKLCYSEFSEEYFYNITSINTNDNKVQIYLDNNNLIIPHEILVNTNEIKLYSIEGKLIDSYEPAYMTSLNFLNSGVYFAVIVAKNKNYVIGFIK